MSKLRSTVRELGLKKYGKEWHQRVPVTNVLNSKTGLFEIDLFEEFINTFKFRNKEVLEFHLKIS